MKLEVRQNIETTNIAGRLTLTGLEADKREVYLNDKRLPPALEAIFLVSFDTLGDLYVRAAIEEMKRAGWKFGE